MTYAQTLLQRADELAEVDPDLARDLLVEVAELAAAGEDEALFAPACELMARILLASGAFALALEPIQAAAEAYARTGDVLGATRTAALQAFQAEPQGFTHDLELIAAENDLLNRRLGPDPLALVFHRTLLDLRRRLPLPGGRPTRAEQLAACLGLSRIQTTLVLLTIAAGAPNWHVDPLLISPSPRDLAGLAERGLTPGGDPRLIAWLAGNDLPPPPEVQVAAPEPLDLTGSLAQAWPDTVAAVDHGQPVVIAGEPTDTRRVAAALAAELGRPLWLLPADCDTATARRLRRDAALADAILALDACERAVVSTAEFSLVLTDRTDRRDLPLSDRGDLWLLTLGRPA